MLYLGSFKKLPTYLQNWNISGRKVGVPENWSESDPGNLQKKICSMHPKKLS